MPGGYAGRAKVSSRDRG